MECTQIGKAAFWKKARNIKTLQCDSNSNRWWGERQGTGTKTWQFPWEASADTCCRPLLDFMVRPLESLMLPESVFHLGELLQGKDWFRIIILKISVYGQLILWLMVNKMASLMAARLTNTWRRGAHIFRELKSSRPHSLKLYRLAAESQAEGQAPAALSGFQCPVSSSLWVESSFREDPGEGRLFESLLVCVPS